MTPGALVLDDIVTIGLVALFGAALLFAAVGALVGHFRGFETGAGVGLLLWGLSGLTTMAWIFVYTRFESTVVELRRSGCEPLPAAAAGAGPRSRDSFVLQRPGAAPRTLVLDAVDAPCAETEPQPQRLRVRNLHLASAGGPVRAERADAADPTLLMGVFGAFGGFGFLGGIVLLASNAAMRRQPSAKAEAAKQPVARWRRSLAEAFNVGGTLTAIAGMVGAGFVDDTTRSLGMAFNAPALACACYFAAMVLQRTASLAAAAILLLVGGGFALAAASVRYMA